MCSKGELRACLSNGLAGAAISNNRLIQILAAAIWAILIY